MLSGIINRITTSVLIRKQTKNVCSVELSLRNHDSVWIPVSFADMNFDVLVVQSLDELLARAFFGSLLAAHFLPLFDSQSVCKSWE